LEATEEELANAATKIGSVYRGKKAREEVAKMKSTTPGEGEDQPEAVAEQAPAEAVPEVAPEENKE